MNALLLALALAAPPQAPATPPQAPAALVERTVPEAGGRRRLSVFADGTAVLAAPTAGGRLLRRRRLDRDELVALLGTVEAARPALEELSPGSGTAELRIARPAGGVLVFRYDPTRVPPLALGRLLAALDDLETRLREAPEVAEEVRGWSPRRGDRVELWGGETAVVTEVRDNGVVVLEHEGSPVIEALRAEDLPARVRRVLGRRE